MDLESVASTSGCVKSDVYDVSRVDITDSVVDISLRNFTAFEDENGTLIYIPDSVPKGEAVLGCNNEISGEANGLNIKANKSNQEPASNVYISTGIYIHPLTFNGSYQNLIELIDIDPNEKLEESPSKKNEKPEEPSTVKPEISNSSYNFTLELQNPTSKNSFSYLQNHTNVAVSGAVQCPDVLYNENYAPEFIDINQLIPKEIKGTVSSFLNTGKKPKENEAKDNSEIDDDVIFVDEWLPPKSKFFNVETILCSESSVSTEAATASEPTTPSGVKRRRRRRTFGEKRKNPVRKAQIDKASLELIEKLAIPPSVFNARVKGRKPRQKIKVETKNVRQSCRTSGAIFSPSRSLTRGDFKEWPADGMHERPMYNEATDTIIKYYVPAAKSGTKRKEASEKQVLSELNSLPDHGSRNQPSDAAKPEETKRSCKQKAVTSKQDLNKLTETALDRVKLMIGYIQELKTFNQLVTTNISSHQDDMNEKLTLYEKSQEFHRQNGRKGPNLGKRLRELVGSSQKRNVQQMVPVLQDTCTLYSLTSGVKSKDFVNLIKNFDSTHTTFG